MKSVWSFLSKEITSFSLTIHVSFEQREVEKKTPILTHLPTEVWPALCSTTMPSRSVKTARVRQAFGQDIFFFWDKKRGNQEQISKNLQEVIYFYSKELWIYEKGPAWDGFVRSQWRWMNNLYIYWYIIHTHIYIYKGILTLPLCSLSLSFFLS